MRSVPGDWSVELLPCVTTTTKQRDRLRWHDLNYLLVRQQEITQNTQKTISNNNNNNTNQLFLLTIMMYFLSKITHFVLAVCLIIVGVSKGRHAYETIHNDNIFGIVREFNCADDHAVLIPENDNTNTRCPLIKAGPNTRRRRLCRFADVAAACPATCGICNAIGRIQQRSCRDKGAGESFKIGRSSGLVNCAWLKRNMDRFGQSCQNDVRVALYCPTTCGFDAQWCPVSTEAPSSQPSIDPTDQPAMVSASEQPSNDPTDQPALMSSSEQPSVVPSGFVKPNATYIPAVWTKAQPSNFPPGRVDTAMAFDQARGRVVMFGGASLNGPPATTWEYDGTNWTESAAASPSARSSHAMAYDESRKRIVLFGGNLKGVGSGRLGDTWEFDGTTWVETSPELSPSPRFRHAMAYDSTRQRIVLFGGNSPAASEFQPGGTWEYNGTTWVLMDTPQSPPGRSGLCMAFDSARNRIVLFGGQRDAFDAQDTWEYDGSTWIEKTTTTAPPAFSAMVYDASRQRVVVGDDPIITWEYDGIDWSNKAHAAGPASRFRPAMAYDSTLEKVVLFGGMTQPQAYPSDTWEYGAEDNAPARQHPSLI